MNSITSQPAAQAQNAAAPEAAATQSSSLQLPLELIIDTLKRRLDLARFDRDPSAARNDLLRSYSLVSRAIGQWAQRELFQHLIIRHNTSLAIVAGALKSKPQLAEAVRSVEFRGHQHGQRINIGHTHLQLVEECTAYHDGNMALQISNVSVGSGELLAFRLMECITIGERCDIKRTNLGSSKTTQRAFVNLHTLRLEVDMLPSSLRNPRYFPALQTLIENHSPPIIEPLPLDERPLSHCSKLLGQLSALHLGKHLERSNPLLHLQHCTSITLLDISIETLTTMFTEADDQLPASVLPPQLHTLRLRSARRRSHLEFNSFLHSGIVLQHLPWCGTTLLALLEAVQEARQAGSSTLQRLMLGEQVIGEIMWGDEPEDEGDEETWARVLRVARQLHIVVVEESGVEQDELLGFDELRREMGI